MDQQKKEPKTGFGKWFIKNLPLFILEAVLLAATVFFMYYVFLTTDSVEKVELDTDSIIVNAEVQDNTEIQTGYTNIALFGVDARDGELDKGTRSDTIIILSVNNETKEIKMVSVYRDTFLNLGNDKYNKCNAAYAQGGASQAINMLNMNMDLAITDYVTVGFAGLIDAIDALGGIGINVTEAEISHLNNYQFCMAEEMGVDYVPVTEPGMQLLNGMQATAYCRIRYTRGDDFKRAERQRDVLIAMMVKAKTCSVMTLKQVVDAVLPQISTSLNIQEMLPLLSGITEYNIVTSAGFPFETNRVAATVSSKGSCVVPTTLEDNVRMLHETLYDDAGYQPSKTVQNFSAAIYEETNQYIR